MPRKSQLSGMIGLAIGAFLACGPLTSGADAEAERIAIQRLSDGYLRNRASFEDIDCRFTLTETHANSAADAIAGRFSGEATPFACLWLVNQAFVRFEKHCPEDVKKKTTEIIKRLASSRQAAGDGATTVGIPGWDALFLRNTESSFALSYSDLIEGATLTPPGTRDEAGIRGTPFDMGVMAGDEFSNPGRYLQDCVSGRFVGRYLGTHEVNGRALEVVTLAQPGMLERMRFGFDPARGYLPAYLSDKAPEEGYQTIYEAFITDAQRCSRDRWFPMRCVIVFSPRNEGEPMSVVEIKVTELDVDNPPARDRFDLVIPAGFMVSVPSGQHQWMHVAQPITVGPGGLDQLYEACKAYGEAYRQKWAGRRPLAGATDLTDSHQDARKSGGTGLSSAAANRRGTALRWTIGIGGGALACLIVILFLWRKGH